MIKGTISKSGQKRIELCMARGDSVRFPSFGSGWFGLYLVTEGACVASFGARRGRPISFTLEPNTVLCLDDSYTVRLTKAEDTCMMTALCFKPTFINANMEQEALACENYQTMADRHGLFRLEPFISHQVRDRACALSPDETAMFIHAMNDIEKLLVEEDDWYWSCRIRSYFMDILSTLDQIRKDRRAFITDSDSALFSNMTAVIRDSMESPLSVEAITARFGINRNKLQGYFHRFAGCSYLEYVQNVRLERIKYYLRFTELSLAEIAVRTGFNSTHNFSRFFKNQTGESATEYRIRTVAERRKDFMNI